MEDAVFIFTTMVYFACNIYIYIVRKGAYSKSFNFFGLVMIAIVISYMIRYTYAFYRFNNYLIPFLWILIGCAIGSIRTTKLRRVFTGRPIFNLTIYTIFIILSVYLSYFVTESEEMLKYFPYVSYFNPIDIYRPEW